MKTYTHNGNTFTEDELKKENPFTNTKEYSQMMAFDKCKSQMLIDMMSDQEKKKFEAESEEYFKRTESEESI